ncbi:MAG: hypothetical protein JXA71_04900, partial [Chitinispirillaceae bacterium]|nr:hypothetical protein [Chitinispirillaceae bacterium]
MRNETSCYSSSALIKYAEQHGFKRDILFKGIESKAEILQNRHEWIDLHSWSALAKNFETCGGNLFDAGMELTENQAAYFPLLFLKIASMRMILKNYSRIYKKKISPLISLTIKESSRGVIDVFFTPKDRLKYSSQICDFNRGCTFAAGRLKNLREVHITEITCAARSESPYCHYQLTWTPLPGIIQRIKDSLYFRFRSQKAILAHMEETYNNLQAQYNEAKQLNEQLSVTLAEKARLSETLQDLNINLERKVAEQTSDIRSKNAELEK